MEEIEVISREKVTVVTQVKEVAHFSGEKGEPGSDGVSVSTVGFTGDDLVFTFSNGQNHTFANVKGQDGTSITDARLENDELIFTNSEGIEINVGKVRGADGVGYTSAYIDGSGNLILVKTDLTEDNAGDLNQTIDSTSSVAPGTILTFTTDGTIDGYIRLNNAQLVSSSAQPDLATSGTVNILPAGSPTSGTDFGQFDVSADITAEVTALGFIPNLGRTILFASDANGTLFYSDETFYSSFTAGSLGKQISFSTNFTPIVASDQDFTYVPCADGTIVRTDGITHSSVSLGSSNIGVISTFICEKTDRLFAANILVGTSIEIYESVDQGNIWNLIYTGTNFAGSEEIITGLIVSNNIENRLLVTSNVSLMRFDSTENGTIFASGGNTYGVSFYQDKFIHYSSGSLSVVNENGFWAGDNNLNFPGEAYLHHRGTLIVNNFYNDITIYPGFYNLPIYLAWIQGIPSPRKILCSNGLVLAISSTGIIRRTAINNSLEDEIVLPAIPDSGDLKYYIKL